MTREVHLPHAISRETGLSTKVPHMVGRAHYLGLIQNYLRSPVERRCVYFYAPGGLGKTRLLDEVVKVANTTQGIHCSGIIDLYHIDTHSHLGVEDAIVAGLDPDKHYFQSYRDRVREYREKHDSDPQSAIVKRLRKELEDVFRSDFETMAQASRKLVLCFDTFEQIQLGGSVADEAAADCAPELWLGSWLIKTLGELRKVLVVLAGRPMQSESTQLKLVETMQRAFGSSFEAIALPPLTLAETRQFINALPDGDKVLPAHYHEVLHRITGGKPIFLHLVVDLLRGLAQDTEALKNRFQMWHRDSRTIFDQNRLGAVQEEIQSEILASLFNQTGELGGYLHYLALLPKGVDREILVKILGLSENRADSLLAEIRPLSFVKEYQPQAGGQAPENGRVFLHDEMYQLLTWPKEIPTTRRHEQDVTSKLVDYLDKQINVQEGVIEQASPQERPTLRHRMQQLQIERMYYLLAAAPRLGYAEYRRLANIATQTDEDDFGMRLLDEFLRFYGVPRRRDQLAAAGIVAEKVTRERTLMWMERLHWGELYQQAVDFAKKVLKDPARFEIREDLEGRAILGNITALWARDDYMINGYREDTLVKAEETWLNLDQSERTFKLSVATELARARLATSIGYIYDETARLAQAGEYYDKARGCFEQLRGLDNDFDVEIAYLLNNLAYLNANRGKMEDANLQANRAQRIFVRRGNERGEAWALSTLANVEIRAGDYDRAVGYADSAFDKFQRAADARGMIFALMGRAQARRKEIKQEVLSWSDRTNLLSIKGQLTSAEDDLRLAIDLADDNGWRNELPRLHAKLAKVCREQGVVAKREKSFRQAQECFKHAVGSFQSALGEGIGGMPALKSKIELFDTRVDLAECYFRSDDLAAANKQLLSLEEKLPASDSEEGRRPEYCRIRGKMERLRGEMALAQPKVALKHYIQAVGYFDRFSPLDRKRRTMSTKVQEILLQLTVASSLDIYAELQQWINDEHPQPADEISEYVSRLG